MEKITTFLITFLIVYLLYFFLVILNKKKMDKYKDNVYVSYLVSVYHLDKEKLPIKKLAYIISLINSFIISFTFAEVVIVENYLFKMLLSLAIMILLTLFIYYILGKNLQKRYKK